jgi:hypothetical protein
MDVYMGVSQSLVRLVLRYSMKTGLYTLHILHPEVKLTEFKFRTSAMKSSIPTHILPLTLLGEVVPSRLL